MKNRSLEVAELESRIARLTDEARRNEETWRRSQRLAMTLLEADGLPALLDRLTRGLSRAYRLQAASVVLADPEHEIRNLLRGQGREPESFENVLFADTTAELAPALRARVRPWLGAYSERAHGRVFPGRPRLASVALLPLARQTQCVGCLNFGSSDPERFTATHATDFLRQLAGIAAFGLENAANRAMLVQRGFTDALTGWHNRGYLETRLGEELARSRRERTSLVCLLLDVDHFKRINDDHGHAAGDAVLKELACRIGAEARGSDIAARYGGEEFIVLMPQTRLETAHPLAERIRSAVSAAPFGAGVLDRPLAVTVSIGLAEYRPAANNEDTEIAARHLVAEADRALYEAKAAGRNAVALAAA